jgi:hypothetical protein
LGAHNDDGTARLTRGPQDFRRGVARGESVFDRNAGHLGPNVLEPLPQRLERLADLPEVDHGWERRRDMKHQEAGPLTARQSTGKVEGVTGRLGEIGRVEDDWGAGHQPLL